MDSSVSPKDEIWFLRVCHHISNAVYALCSSTLPFPHTLFAISSPHSDDEMPQYSEVFSLLTHYWHLTMFVVLLRLFILPPDKLNIINTSHKRMCYLKFQSFQGTSQASRNNWHPLLLCSMGNSFKLHSGQLAATRTVVKIMSLYNTRPGLRSQDSDSLWNGRSWARTPGEGTFRTRPDRFRRYIQPPARYVPDLFRVAGIRDKNNTKSWWQKYWTVANRAGRPHQRLTAYSQGVTIQKCYMNFNRVRTKLFRMWVE